MQSLEEASHQIEGDTGTGDGSNCEGASAEQASLSVNAKAEVFRDGAGSGAIVDGRYVEGRKEYCGDGAEGEEEGSLKAVPGSGCTHGDDLLGAETGGDEGDGADPRWQGAAGARYGF